MAPSLNELGLLGATGSLEFDAHIAAGEKLVRAETLTHDEKPLVLYGDEVVKIEESDSRLTRWISYASGKDELVGVEADVYEWQAKNTSESR